MSWNWYVSVVGAGAPSPDAASATQTGLSSARCKRTDAWKLETSPFSRQRRWSASSWRSPGTMSSGIVRWASSSVEWPVTCDSESLAITIAPLGVDYGHAQRRVGEGRPEQLAELCDLEPGVAITRRGVVFVLDRASAVTDHAAHSRPSTDPSGCFYTFSWSNANTITPSTGQFTRSLNEGSWRGQRRGSRRAAASRPLPGSRPRACRPARRRGRRARAGPSRGSRRRRRRRRRRRPRRRRR